MEELARKGVWSAGCREQQDTRGIGSNEYEPANLLAQALSLRTAAATAAAQTRAEYLAMAEKLEHLVKRSTETPPVED